MCAKSLSVLVFQVFQCHHSSNMMFSVVFVNFVEIQHFKLCFHVFVKVNSFITTEDLRTQVEASNFNKVEEKEKEGNSARFSLH